MPGPEGPGHQNVIFSAICTSLALFCSVGSTLPKLALVGSVFGPGKRT